MTNTPITNESEAMEVWRKAKAAWDRQFTRTTMDQAAARVIATALEARDARIRELEEVLEDMLGGDIDVSATALIYGDDLRDCLKEWRAILTKGETTQ